MKRFITLAALVAMGLAVPALQSGVNADPPKRYTIKTCVTGKNRSTGRVIELPPAPAKRIIKARIGCGVSRYVPVGDPCRCRIMIPPK